MVPTRPALGHYGLDEEGDTVRRYINYFMINTMSSAYAHSLSIVVGFPMLSP